MTGQNRKLKNLLIAPKFQLKLCFYYFASGFLFFCAIVTIAYQKLLSVRNLLNDNPMTQWRDLLNPGDRIQAPGGGLAYDVLGNKKIDYNATGAIRIVAPKNQLRVDVFRPAYLGLKKLRARINRDSIKIKEF